MKNLMKQIVTIMLVIASVIFLWQPAEVQAASKEPRLSSKSITLEPYKIFENGHVSYNDFKIKVLNANANVKWTYDKDYIKAYNEDGSVGWFYPLKAGKTTIKCKIGKKTLSCKVTIKASKSEANCSIKSKKLGKNILEVTIKNKGKAPTEGRAKLDIYDSEWKAAGTRKSDYVRIAPGEQVVTYITELKDWNYEKPYADMSVMINYSLLVDESKITVNDSEIEYVEEEEFGIRSSTISVPIMNKSSLPVSLGFSILAYKNGKLYAIYEHQDNLFDGNHNLTGKDIMAKEKSTVTNIKYYERYFETVSGKPFNSEGVTYKFHLNWMKYDEYEF